MSPPSRAPLSCVYHNITAALAFSGRPWASTSCHCTSADLTSRAFPILLFLGSDNEMNLTSQRVNFQVFKAATEQRSPMLEVMHSPTEFTQVQRPEMVSLVSFVYPFLWCVGGAEFRPGRNSAKPCSHHPATSALGRARLTLHLYLPGLIHFCRRLLFCHRVCSQHNRTCTARPGPHATDTATACQRKAGEARPDHRSRPLALRCLPVCRLPDVHR